MEYTNLTFGDIVMLLAERLRLFNEAPNKIIIEKQNDGGYSLSVQFNLQKRYSIIPADPP